MISPRKKEDQIDESIIVLLQMTEEAASHAEEKKHSGKKKKGSSTKIKKFIILILKSTNLSPPTGFNLTLAMGLSDIKTLEMRDNKMKIIKTVSCILAGFYLSISAAGAAELESGFMGIQWASPAAHQEGLTRLYTREDVVYYTQPDIVHTIHNIQVPNVVYGFYKDQFFAVYVNLESEEVFGEFRNYLRSRYGNPDKRFSMKTSETVYKWNQGKVKIKLKTNEENYRMKLGFYYLPLSQKVNEEQMDQYHNKSLQIFPIKKDEQPEIIPLFQF